MADRSVMTSNERVEEQILQLVRDGIEGNDPDLDQLAEVVLVHALGHTRLRDAIIATMTGEHQAAQAILTGQRADLTFLSSSLTPTHADAAINLLERLIPVAQRHNQSLLNATLTVQSLMFWLSRRPIAALEILNQVDRSYPLAQAVRQALLIGYPQADLEAS